MFTGIVEATGEVVEREETAEGLRLRVAAPFADELEHGQSVAVSGACLTVEDHDADAFSLFCSEETVERTYLGTLREGDAVNLERALPADGRFDGHFVQGHVDGVGEVRAVEQVGDDWLFAFSLPDDLRRYVVEKGSVSVDGISLTVADLRDDEFTVAVIPATYDITTLHAKAAGDPVHLEVDVVAKYVESLTEGYVDG
ncbi:riboflavin synthase [Halorarius halobius]|uniref:riboflavin synthase n=1 Tax=Halorarius halobius TaxID=2962671 RepID=UPI0020CBE43F|nr:riboflavin synthase [Halorarius halobius]